MGLHLSRKYASVCVKYIILRKNNFLKIVNSVLSVRVLYFVSAEEKFQCPLGKPKKSSSFNGRAIKRGGGVRGQTIKEKNFFF